MNTHKLIAEEYYLRNDKQSLKLAKAFNYEVEYHQEMLDAQIIKVNKLKAKEGFLNNMQQRHNQLYDYKYHNFMKRQHQKLKDNKYQQFVKGRQQQSENLSQASSSHE